MEETGPTRKIIRATREVVVIINGEEFDALLVPRNAMVEVDFSKYPEDDPMRRGRNVERLTEIDLELGPDLHSALDGVRTFKLTAEGAKRLLDSL